MIRYALWLIGLALGSAAAAERVNIEIRQQTLALQPVAAASGLTLTGAWRLSSDHPQFGGFSGLAFAEGELLLLSDAGVIVRWTPGAANAVLKPLPEACREGTGSHAADAEAMALTPDGLELRVALERGNRLCSFSLSDPTGARSFDLEALLPSRRNRGVEAMATLPHRGTLLIAEAGQGGTHTALWFDTAARDTPSATMRYRAPVGFKPGDAAFLRDGRLLVVNRRFEFPDKRATVMTLAPFAPEPGAEVSGTEILRLENGSLAANYEGIAVAPTVEGATIWMISDDNFSNRSGTMLLRFELDAAARPVPGGTIAAPARW